MRGEAERRARMVRGGEEVREKGKTARRGWWWRRRRCRECGTGDKSRPAEGSVVCRSAWLVAIGAVGAYRDHMQNDVVLVMLGARRSGCEGGPPRLSSATSHR